LEIISFVENVNVMTTVIIDEKSKKGKIILELIEELGIGKIVGNEKMKTVKPNQVTLDAIKEAYEGNTVVCEDFQDYINKTK
jgi:lysophospholipid acyltransferase (LPLAT)-like uncharacterized protein